MSTKCGRSSTPSSRECVFAKEIMPQGMDGWKIRNVSNIFTIGAVEEDGTGVAV